MMWNVLKFVLGLVLLMYCLPTGESKECDKTEIIVGRLGKELKLYFPFSDLLDKYKEYIIENYGEKVVINETEIQDLKKESDIRFKTKTNDMAEKIIYKNNNSIYGTSNRTDIFMANDTLVVKKTKLQKEDAGIYWIEFRSIRLGHKALIITDKPIIRCPPNPVLKPKDNYISTIQLECHSVSTSIGECPLSMYTVWYRNGMRMTDVDPTLSQINLNVDHNGGNFTCLATDYPPCYQKLQTTKHYDVLNIEECNNVSESKSYIVPPDYKQREIPVNKNRDLKVSCSAKCHPICEVKWEKDYKGNKSTSFITESLVQSDLELTNIHKSHAGVYVCLVENIHGEIEKNFTLSVGGTWVNEQNNESSLVIIIVVVIVIGIGIFIVSVIVYILYKIRKKRKSLERRQSIEMDVIPLPVGRNEIELDGGDNLVDETETTDLNQNKPDGRDEVVSTTTDLQQDKPLLES